MNSSDMAHTASTLRNTIIDMIYHAGSGHAGGSLSCCEILTVLYDSFIKIDPQNPKDPERDRFILSKGHAAPALYATLARKGFFDPALLYTLRQIGSPLQGHPNMHALPGIEMSTGSLGMGVSVGTGMALSMRRRNESGHVWVLCGDGELQEGSNWEAFQSLAKWNLSSVTVIIDRNGVQLDGTVEEIKPMGCLAAKLYAFGLHVISCDGHNTAALTDAYEQALVAGAPCAIIADTVKGKGVSFMEGKSIWHGKQIGPEEYTAAKKELEVQP